MVAAALRQRHHVVAGQLLAMEFAPAIQAQVLVAREQRRIGQCRRGIEGMRPRMPASGDDGMQFHQAAFAGHAAGAAMHGQAGVAQGPRDRAARIQAGRVLPAHPVEHAAVRIEREQAHRVEARGHGAQGGEGGSIPGRIRIGTGLQQAELRSVRLHWNPSLYASRDGLDSASGVERGRIQRHERRCTRIDRRLVLQRARQQAGEVEARGLALGVLECLRTR